MRVLHLSTFDTRGGAARGAYWLHRALADGGVDSRMLVGRKYGNDPSVVEPQQPLGRVANALRSRLDTLPLRAYRKTGGSYWTVGWLPDRIDRLVAAQDPDIVHIHWTGGGFLSVHAMRTLGYPVVWTLRDMWAFTGGCHYSTGCDRFAEGCGICPQLGSGAARDLSHRMWQRKLSAWRNMDLAVVPISAWLADCAERSHLFDAATIDVIPNGIDTARFRPFDADEAKAAWRLRDDKIHVLFGAIDATADVRKGFHRMVEASHLLSAACWSQRMELVVFGGTRTDFSEMGLPVRSVGHVDDDEALAKLYAACDVMVVPSEQEAFGKTLVEAMACATPVVAFNEGGPVDIVDHQRTGYLAEPFSAESLAAGIAWCVEDRDRTVALGRLARNRAVENFDIGAVARRYRALYDRVLARAA